MLGVGAAAKLDGLVSGLVDIFAAQGPDFAPEVLGVGAVVRTTKLLMPGTTGLLSSQSINKKWSRQK